MKKVLIVLIFFLIPSCSFFEIAIGFGGIMKPFIKIQKQVNKIEKICNKECKRNEKYSNEWCDCMHFCLNSDDKWHESLEGKWIWDNDYTTTTIEEGSVNIILNECPLDSTDTNPL